jgi:hypothetical protein
MRLLYVLLKCLLLLFYLLLPAQYWYKQVQVEPLLYCRYLVQYRCSAVLIPASPFIYYKSVSFFQAGPLGYFIHISITTSVVSALKNYYTQRVSFHFDPELGSRGPNAAKNYLNHPPLGFRPLQLVSRGGVHR